MDKKLVVVIMAIVMGACASVPKEQTPAKDTAIPIGKPITHDFFACSNEQVAHLLEFAFVLGGTPLLADWVRTFEDHQSCLLVRKREITYTRLDVERKNGTRRLILYRAVLSGRHVYVLSVK